MTKHDTHAIAEALEERITGASTRTNEVVYFDFGSYDVAGRLYVLTGNLGDVDVHLSLDGLDVETTEEILDVLARRAGG